MRGGAEMLERPVAELVGRGAEVHTRYGQDLSARIEVRYEEGLHAARVVAQLVRQAVLDASAVGARTVQLTLDVCSPVSGCVLGELHDMLGRGVADIRVRRAGGTLLTDVRLVGRPSGLVARAPTATLVGAGA